MPSKIMRGRREGRVSADTRGPRAKKMHGAGTTGIAGYPGLPCANGFNGFLRALPGDQTLLSPSPARRESVFANLAPALGRQDHTTSPSAAARARPAQLPRPSQPATQRIVTTRTPLCMRRDASREDTVWPRGEAEYFSRYDWTSGIALKRREKFDFWRRDFECFSAASCNPKMRNRAHFACRANHPAGARHFLRVIPGRDEAASPESIVSRRKR